MGMLKKDSARIARKQRIRKRISGSTARPRLSIFRSSRYTYVQIIDDQNGKTLVSCSSAEKDFAKKVKCPSNMDAAKAVGIELAVRAKAKKIDRVVFDRNGNIFHGRVKALADGAREGGLLF